MPMGQRGFTLIELMIVAGAMAGLTLVTMNIFKQGAKASSDLNARQEARDLRDQFSAAVKTGTCGLVPVDFETNKIVVDTSVAIPTNLGTFYSKQGSFTAGQKLGTLSIAPLNTNPITIGPPSADSPLIANCANFTDGNYCQYNDGYLVADITIKLKKPKIAGNALLPLKFTTLITLNASNEIVGCKSMTEVTLSKETCDTMTPQNGGISFQWDDSNFTCNVTKEDPAPDPSGNYSQSDPGNTAPNYIL